MSRTVQCTSTPIDPSIPFSILDLKAQAVRLPVSKGAQILLSELLTWSGERGYCWWSNNAIARDLKWSSSCVWRRTSELQGAGLLASIPRPGRSNYWVPLPGPAKMARLKNELSPLADSRGPFLKENEKLKRCTVPQPSTGTEQPHPSPESNVNAVKLCSKDEVPSDSEPISPRIPIIISESRNSPAQLTTPRNSSLSTAPTAKAPLTDDQRFLMETIEQTCSDFHSRGHFINLTRRYDEQTIHMALSITREKIALESGVKGGAYFTATLRALAEASSAQPGNHQPEQGYDRPAFPKPSSSVESQLDRLQDQYPHLLVHPLFDRYVTVKTQAMGAETPSQRGSYLGSYEAFLRDNHEQIYETKPRFRADRSERAAA